MKIRAVSKPNTKSVLVCSVDSAAYQAVDPALRNECERQLKRSALVVVPSLGLIPQPALCVFRAPAWEDLVAVRRRGGAIVKKIVQRDIPQLRWSLMNCRVCQMPS